MPIPYTTAVVHDGAAIEQSSRFSLVLPWPISLNAYYMGVGNSHAKTITKKGREWRKSVIAAIHEQTGGLKPEPLIGRCGLRIDVYPPDDKRRRDLDNFTGKHLWDALVKAGLLGDDDQIVLEVKERKWKDGKGHLLLELWEL